MSGNISIATRFVDSSNAEMSLESMSPSSPLSRNSSDALHDARSSIDEREVHAPSPLCSSTLNFGGLQIRDDNNSHSQQHMTRFTDYAYNSPKHHRSSAPAYVQPFHHHRRQSSTRLSCNHRSARSLMSEEGRAAQDFLVIRNSMKRLFKNSDVAKWKIVDYMAHREAVDASHAKQVIGQAQKQEDYVHVRALSIPPQIQELMRAYGLPGNFDRVGNYSLALGEKTIWCEDWQNGKEEIAPWPCSAELKWEGDDRAKTNVGRYPPLPREQGPIGLHWNQLQAVEQYPLDQIARIPTMEDVYLPVDEIDDDVKYDLLNKDLEDAMVAYLES